MCDRSVSQTNERSTPILYAQREIYNTAFTMIMRGAVKE